MNIRWLPSGRADRDLTIRLRFGRMEDMARSREMAILGPGRVGTAVGILAHRADYRVVSVGARNPEAAERAAADISPRTKACGLEEAAGSCDFVLLTVSDDAIETVCDRMVAASAFRQGARVVHCSGALPSGVLRRAREKLDCVVASIHPLQTFPTVEAAVQSLPGTSWFCEGDERALDGAFELIRAIGGTPHTLSSEAKALYHVAAVLACNDLTALMETSLTAAEAAGVKREAFWPAVLPLIRSTLENIGKLGTVKALTGPVARGDVKTISRHLEAIARHESSLTEVYKVLGEWTVRLSAAKGVAQTSNLDQIRKLLR